MTNKASIIFVAALIGFNVGVAVHSAISGNVGLAAWASGVAVFIFFSAGRLEK